MSMRVYVAAPFCRAVEALAAHHALVAVGLQPVSRWVRYALESGGVDAPSPEVARHAISQNDDDVVSADAVLALSYPREGGEMFAEVRFALLLGKPVLWVQGRQILSAHRRGVVLVASLSEAVAWLVERSAPAARESMPQVSAP